MPKARQHSVTATTGAKDICKDICDRTSDCNGVYVIFTWLPPTPIIYSFQCVLCADQQATDVAPYSEWYLQDYFETYEWYNHVRTPACADCAKNTYKDVYRCVECPPNTVSTEGSNGIGLCICDKGFTRPLAWWDWNYYGNDYEAYNDDTMKCEECKAGKYQDEASSLECEDCADGFFSLDGASTCTQCAPGKYEDNNECVSCTAGKYNSDTNDICLDCADGFYSNEGASICTVCNPGKYEDAIQFDNKCLECDAGKFKDNSNYDNICLDCANGHVSNAGASICTDCIPGKYEENNVCKLCFMSS